MHAWVPAHAHMHVSSYSFPPPLCLFLLSVSLCLSVSLSLRRWQRVTVSSRACPSLAPCQAHVLGTRWPFLPSLRYYHHICSLMSVMRKACPAYPCTHKIFIHLQLADTLRWKRYFPLDVLIHISTLYHLLLLSDMYSSTAAQLQSDCSCSTNMSL